MDDGWSKRVQATYFCTLIRLVADQYIQKAVKRPRFINQMQ